MRKYEPYKWYKVPKRGLRSDGSGTGILIRNKDNWYFSNAEVMNGHYSQINPTHFMWFPGHCNNWMGPNHVQKWIKTT